ncbi:Uncharacterised protein [Mycobacterium tuberculosis]|nr:Uncharacterised protein [Mycobacterium tuberculosis]
MVPQPNTVSAVNTASSRTNDSESAVWPGVANTVMVNPATSITSPSVSVSPSRRKNCGSAARTGAPVSATSLSMPLVWSP